MNSLHEESITSSQLEGADTTRKAAKQMLRESRQPRTHGERMIVNNFVAMEHVRQHPTTPLTVEEICEIHRLISNGTLDDPADEGRPQSPEDERVGVYWQTNGIDEKIHQPPPASQIPGRLLLHGRSDLNHRQLTLLGHALRHPGGEYKIRAHEASHKVVYESARQDLLGVSNLGLLERFKSGREFIFRSPLDLDRRLKAV